MWRAVCNVEFPTKVCYCNIYLQYNIPSKVASADSVRCSARRVYKYIIQKIEYYTFEVNSEFKLLLRNCRLRKECHINIGTQSQGYNRIQHFAIQRYLRFGNIFNAEYKNIFKFSTQKCGYQTRLKFIRYSLEKGNFLSNNIPIHIKNLTSRMSANEKTSVKKQKTNSDKKTLENVHIDDPDISIEFEKLNSDHQIQNESSSKDYICFLKKSSSGFQSNPQGMKVESSSHCHGTSRARNQKAHLSELRQWEHTTYGKESNSDRSGKVNSHHFTVMSYNVLSQILLENHPHLYYDHEPAALSWEWRSKALMKEIEAASPDILCLQEVQESHLASFYIPKLQNLGYSGIFKKRTGDKPDGVAIYYKVSAFCLEEYATVEFMQPIMPVLNRDNVALIARFSSRVTPSLPHVCIATTHLLYNPRRMDVKLAQIQLLLAELERLAYVGNCSATSYHPIIITGDLNVTPKSSLYRLLTSGVLWDSDITDGMFDLLGITHNCQHFSILNKRQSSGAQNCDRNSELRGLKVYNSDNVEAILKMTSRDDSSEEVYGLWLDRKKGHLSHNFTLNSVYKHRNSRGKEATTKQDKWVTVDYIFYSCMARDLNLEPIEGNLKLVARYGLLCKEECFTYGPIPNLCSPSDHFPLICKFSLTS